MRSKFYFSIIILLKHSKMTNIKCLYVFDNSKFSNDLTNNKFNSIKFFLKKIVFKL